MNLRTCIAALLSVGVLASCAESTNAIVQTFRQAVPGRAGALDSRPLDPQLRYLRVVIDGRVALLVLGYVEASAGGPVELWYSAEKEVLRLQNGRVVGLSGSSVEWRNVSLPAFPAWSVLAQDDTPIVWQRKRDELPGYRYGITESLKLVHLAVAPRSALQGVEAGQLVWFEETQESSSSDDRLPPARYAIRLGDGVAVYGEQCLTRKFCFSWQRWPAGS